MGALLSELEQALAPRQRARAYAWGLAGIGLSLSVVAASLWFSNSDAAPCELDGSELVGVWDDGRQAELARAFAATGLRFAEPNHVRVAARLDAWAEGWLDAKRRACVETQIKRTASSALLDRRVDCLERQRREFAGLIDVFVAGGTGPLARSPELLAELPDTSTCARPPEPGAAAMLPRDPDARQAVFDGYQQLARTRAQLAAGEVDASLALAQDVEQQGRALAYLPLELEGLSLRGTILARRGRFDEGAELLLAAVHRASRAQLGDLELDARARSVGALAGRWSKPDLEQLLIDEFEAAIPEQPTVAQQTMVLGSRARLAMSRGEDERALELYAELRRLHADDEVEPGVWLDEAAVLVRLARFEDARTQLHAGLELERERWGPGSLLGTEFERDLGLVALEFGEFDEARRWLALAREHLESSVGSDSVRVGRVRFAQVKLDLGSGEFERARVELDAVLTIYERELGRGHKETGEVFNALGVTRFYVGDYRGSIDAYERALAIAIEIFGRVDVEVAQLHANIAESQAALGQHEDALAGYARAIATVSVAASPEHPAAATAHKGRGQSLLALGRAEEAIPELELALAMNERGDEPFELADTRHSLALALREAQRDLPRVRSLSLAAAEAFAALGFAARAEAAERTADALSERGGKGRVGGGGGGGADRDQHR